MTIKTSKNKPPQWHQIIRILTFYYSNEISKIECIIKLS